MPIVTYELADGSVHRIEVSDGHSVMDGSVRNNLPGIVAECGGSCSCATCHVFLDHSCTGHFEAPSREELELLEFTEGAQPTSRLSCQLVLSADSPEVRVVVPDTNG